jgi:hypothetical protein
MMAHITPDMHGLSVILYLAAAFVAAFFVDFFRRMK